MREEEEVEDLLNLDNVKIVGVKEPVPGETVTQPVPLAYVLLGQA